MRKIFLVDDYIGGDEHHAKDRVNGSQIYFGKCESRNDFFNIANEKKIFERTERKRWHQVRAWNFEKQHSSNARVSVKERTKKLLRCEKNLVVQWHEKKWSIERCTASLIV